MAWHKDPVDLTTWTNNYALRRYGSSPDEHAQRAWQILLHTAYAYRAGDGTAKGGDPDAPQDSLFNAQPSLTTTHAGTWAPERSTTIPPTCIPPSPNSSRSPPPSATPKPTSTISSTSPARSWPTSPASCSPKSTPPTSPTTAEAFRALTRHWLHRMQLQDNLLATNQYFLLGRWLANVPPWASSPAELKLLNYDARSILTTWGDRTASEAGLHEYANRDYAGLTSAYYAPRWQLYFHSLQLSLDTHTPPKPIDWYAFGDHWNRHQTPLPRNPTGNPYTAAMAIANDLNLAPPQPHQRLIHDPSRHLCTSSVPTARSPLPRHSPCPCRSFCHSRSGETPVFCLCLPCLCVSLLEARSKARIASTFPASLENAQLHPTTTANTCHHTEVTP